MTVLEKRLELHEILCGLLGSANVYFQPPESVRMKYPAILYKRSKIANEYADNDVYRQTMQYQVTVMDYDPDSVIPLKVSKLPTCSHERSYCADNLNHDVFTLYY